MRVAFVVCLCSLLFVTGCKVGPDYETPYTEMPVELKEARPGLTFAITDEELVAWWELFNDPLLDDLLEQAICGSFDYQIALEKVCQARAQYWVQFTQIFPEFVGDFLGTRYRVSRSFRNAISPVNPTFGDLNPIQDFFQIGLDAIWEIDLFGKFRRSADASYDLWKATADEARAVKITVLSEVAVTYVTIRAYQKKIQIQKQFLKLASDLVTLAKSKFQSGLSDEQTVVAFVASLESYKAALMVLETALRQNIYSLGILLGENPENLVARFETPAPIPYALDMVVPAGIPADLLRRRPDITSAERRLAAATEQIGVAMAELFPSVSLAGSSSNFASNPLQGANIGYTSDEFSKLFRSGSRIWGIGAFVQWPVFDFGKRYAGVCVQESLTEQAYLTYQKAVVLALQEAESALVAYFNEQDRLTFLHQQETAAKRSFELSEDLFLAGLIDNQQLLQTEETWLSVLNNIADSEQALASDIVAIYKAMGGDW